MRRILLEFRHGLGDAVQLTSVLLQLRAAHPDWSIDVAALRGKHTAFHGLAENVFSIDDDGVPSAGYCARYNLAWHEPVCLERGLPSTKAERCLREVFQIEPRPELCRYEIRIGDAARAAAAEWYDRHGVPTSDLRPPPSDPLRRKAVFLHYQGNTSAGSKNLRDETAWAVLQTVLAAGYVPVLLDWDQRSRLRELPGVLNPGADDPLWGRTGTGDAERLAALLDSAALCVAIDSGPQKVAAATRCPTLAVWTRHHPLHYCGLNENVTHVVPAGIDLVAKGDPYAAHQFFRHHYSSVEYPLAELTPVLCAEVGRRLDGPTSDLRPPTSGLIRLGDWTVRGDNIEQDLQVIHDVYDGDCYRLSIQAANVAAARFVVDVGAHLGSFARRFHAVNPAAKIVCVEACPDNDDALRANVGEFATLVPAACTYEAEDVALLNAVYPHCDSTGGSIVQPRSWFATHQAGPSYRADLRPLPKVTLEQILADHSAPRIDVLKLDCEGSEFSILEHADLDRILLIVGEYHGRARWLELVARRFLPAGWSHSIQKDGEIGLFHLQNDRLMAASPAAG